MHQSYFSRPINVGYRHGVPIIHAVGSSFYGTDLHIGVLSKTSCDDESSCTTADNDVIVSDMNSLTPCRAVWMPVGGTSITRDIHFAGHCRSAHCGSDKEARKGVALLELCMHQILLLMHL